LHVCDLVENQVTRELGLGVLSALRARDFRLLWLSQTVSVIGDALVIVVIGLYVTRLTGRPGDVAIVLAAYALPLVLFVLIGGVVADRLPRQTVMVASDLARAMLHGTLALLIAFDVVQIWHMVLIGAVYGTAEAFFRPAYTGLVPQTVGGDEDIQGAQALGGLSAEFAEFASPALATALVLGLGGAFAFALDAATFVISAALVVRIRPRARGVQAERQSMLVELREGWWAVKERPWVLWTVVAFCVAVTFALAPFLVLGASLARQQYGTEAVFGWANTAFGAGTVTGVFMASRWEPAHPMRVAMIAAIPWPAALALYAVGPPLGWLYPVLALAGGGIGVFAVFWETALAQRVPPHLLSRVSAWDWMGSLALLPVGYLVAGALARSFGSVAVLLFGGIVASTATALGLLPRATRNLRRIDSPGATASQPVLALY
jgi:MFS family permease